MQNLSTLDPGWKKIRIQDKHPGSTKLFHVILYTAAAALSSTTGVYEQVLIIGRRLHK